MEEVKISTEYITLDQFLKYVGIAETGGKGKQMILDGLVRVNGNIELKRGKKLRKGDTVVVNEKQFVIK
ncbi:MULTISPECIES: RNA-binding S4 domain-containing protein [unclassified Thermoanaerobacterium]|uniref:RNA-binding S4 domain-containing protein n=1 Tax=unclassified Thermoanaerobacterium TaxID=2622527 RepID=UPI000A16A2B9|nr:RNA-binding S4 domain-containing protein [Thermoanaerobacterium sp. R66]MDE4542999.1 RNA-binding S4 domain-containing protein [Thermoanaerobacterium sp. R66]ORX22787.1 RNA-binding protein [Thermoanaerobacterium sp. PSU-2]HHV74555.1 RNA-binding S4 domain-containing protein [Thermoanaerobacterium sp.]